MRRPRAHAARSSQAVAEMGRISARLIARAASPGRALGILDREWERPIRRLCHLHPLIAGVEARKLIYSLRQGAKQPKPEQWVYFIQAGSEGPIKIGIADSPALRLRELQTGNHLPLTLLKAVPGGKDLETELHRELAAYRLCREWF